MLLRNIFFVGVIFGGIVGIRAALFPPPIPPHAAHFDPGVIEAADFRSLIDQVNAAIESGYSKDSLQPAPAADPLIVMRRLHLGLLGSIPSLQEIRQFEAYQGEHRLQWWLDGLLQNRRCADYLAERLTRAYVGTEDGPFLVFRRRRFAT